ncbi:hypothetical protein Pst134EB_001828 [Puccinia striiformis f. sp. tritici]|nr:hypothetical protein Pst134EB_001828 [Puccinia striiformis f. sp. tritici]
MILTRCSGVVSFSVAMALLLVGAVSNMENGVSWHASNCPQHDIRWKTFSGECKNRCGNVISDQFGYETCKGCGGLKSMDRREMNICTKESCRSLPLHVSMRAKHAPGCSTLVVPTEYSGHCDRCFKSMMCKACSWACTNQDCPYEVARQEIPYCGKCCAEHGMPIITQVDLKET